MQNIHYSTGFFLYLSTCKSLSWFAADWEAWEASTVCFRLAYPIEDNISRRLFWWECKGLGKKPRRRQFVKEMSPNNHYLTLRACQLISLRACSGMLGLGTKCLWDSGTGSLWCECHLYRKRASKRPWINKNGSIVQLEVSYVPGEWELWTV